MKKRSSPDLIPDLFEGKIQMDHSFLIHTEIEERHIAERRSKSKHKYRILPNSLQSKLPFAGDSIFHAWAKVFFKSKRLNEFVPYSDAIKSYRENTIHKDMPALQFKRELASWCKAMGYILDPEELRNSAGRIIRKREVAFGKSVATEMLFIKTK